MTSVAFGVDQAFYQVPGGIGTYQRELIPALAAAGAGLAITLFHARFDRPPEPWMRRFPVVGLRWRHRLLYATWAIAGRPRLPVALSELDILHTPSPSVVPPAGADQRLVVTVHDLAFLVHPEAFPATSRALFRAGLRRAVASADAFITPSKHTAEDLRRLARVPDEKLHVVPLAASVPPSDTAAEAILGRRSIPMPYVLYVGTLEPRKNLVRLVRAYRSAVDRADLPHVLILAGPPGWRSDALREEISRDGRGRVVLAGHVTLEELDALYRGADAFVYPSLYEGFGLPVLEAMARGTPAIASRSSSLPEVAGHAALLVDPLSETELASAIERVLTDRGERERLAAVALERSREFSWERTARETLAVYRSLS